MLRIRPIVLAIVAGGFSALVSTADVSAADAAAVPASVAPADTAAPPAAAAPGGAGVAKGTKVAPAQVPAAKAPAAKTPGTESEPPVPKLTAVEIVDKHVAARGGTQAWKTVQTMQLSGTIEAGRGDNVARARQLSSEGRSAGGRATKREIMAAKAQADVANRQIQLPFTLDLQRPNRTRLEIVFNGKTAVQVYDGEHGWKYRPFLNRSDAEPFTAEEASTESTRGDLDGPLIDYAAKGTQVELEGSDLVETQPAYRLKVTDKSGSVKHVWIDAKTFLDVKVEGFPKRMDGKMHPVYVYQRDFRTVQGVIIPFVQETAVEGFSDTHKLQIEKAAVNPSFDDTVFAKPHA